VFGEPVQFKSVIHARSLGIDTVYQDLALVPGLSVYHNMFLKREHTRLKVLDNRSMRNQARSHLNSLGVNIPDVNAEVASLSGGQRQAIAVARSVFSDARIILLDEPLAAMGAKEGGLILADPRPARARRRFADCDRTQLPARARDATACACCRMGASPSTGPQQRRRSRNLKLVGAEYRVPDS
jgi:hypothetical protein